MKLNNMKMRTLYFKDQQMRVIFDKDNDTIYLDYDFCNIKKERLKDGTG